MMTIAMAMADVGKGDLPLGGRRNHLGFSAWFFRGPWGSHGGQGERHHGTTGLRLQLSVAVLLL